MAWNIRLRDNEECSDQPFLTPDLVITQNFDTEIALDFALADPDETTNRMGLRSKAALHTAILIQLFTDRRARADMTLPDDLDNNPRGWWGDSVALDSSLGETELGSHLWTLRRSALSDQTANLAADMVRDALQPIADQGAVASFTVETWVDKSNGLLGIDIGAYSNSGTLTYNQKFEILWQQIGRLRQ